MTKLHKISLSLLLLATMACGKHQLPAKQESANTSGGDTPGATPPKTLDDKKTVENTTVDTNATSLIIGGDTKFGSHAFKVLTSSPEFTDETLDKLLQLASDKFKSDFDSENFLSVLAKVDGGQVKLSKGFADLITVVDQISKKDGKLFITTPTNDQDTKILSHITVGSTKIKLRSGQGSRGVTPVKKDIVVEPLENKYPVKMILDNDTLKYDLPLFHIMGDDASKFAPLTFDLSQSETGYGANIRIDQLLFKVEQPVECMIMHVEKDPKATNFALTNFANFRDQNDGDFDFSGLELEEMKKLPKDVDIPVSLACFTLVSSVTQKNNAIILTYLGFNMKVIESGKTTPAIDKSKIIGPQLPKNALNNSVLNSEITQSDPVKPMIAITSPADQAESEDTVEIKGTATPGSTLTIEGDFDQASSANTAVVGPEGNFTFTGIKLKNQDLRVIKITATKDGVVSETATVNLKKKKSASAVSANAEKQTVVTKQQTSKKVTANQNTNTNQKNTAIAKTNPPVISTSNSRKTEVPDTLGIKQNNESTDLDKKR